MDSIMEEPEIERAVSAPAQVAADLVQNDRHTNVEVKTHVLEKTPTQASLVTTVARMMVREKTFLTIVGEERSSTESRRESDFEADDSDSDGDDVIDDVSEYDVNHNYDVRRKGRRKKPAFDIDADFNFDEDDEEEIRRRAKKKKQKITTEVVYERACEKCRLPPCHTYQQQITNAVVSLRAMNLGPSEIKPIAISLVKDRSIMTLDLSNNNIGPVGVMYIAEMIQENVALIDLNLSGTNPGRAGLEALAETLRLNNSLRILHLADNYIEPSQAAIIANIIQNCPKLHDLYLGHNRLGASGGKVIADALTKCSSLRSLDLQWNHLRRESAVELSKALATNKSLRFLNVAWNGFGKEGCLALARSLPVNSSLQELDLTCNRIDYQSLNFLSHGLFRNKGLTTVKLGHNPMTTNGAIELLKVMRDAKNSKMRELCLEDVPVDEKFLDILESIQDTRIFKVVYGHVMKLATHTALREHDGNNLSRYEPTLVLFEYMRMDNLRVIDMFKSFDVNHRDKLSRADIKEGINTLKIPFTEHALDEIMEKLDKNKDGMIDLEEMMKGSKEMSRYVNQRVLKARAKKREDQGLISLRKALKDIIKKRKKEQEESAQDASKQRQEERKKSEAAASSRSPDLSNMLRKMQLKKAAETGVIDEGQEGRGMGVAGVVKLAAMRFQRKRGVQQDQSSVSSSAS